MLTKSIFCLYFTIALIVIHGHVHATLIGDTVSACFSVAGNCDGVSPPPNQGTAAVTDTGIEFGFNALHTAQQVDITADSIRFYAESISGTPVDFDAGDSTWAIFDLDWADHPDGFIVDLVLSSSDLLGGITSFTEDRIDFKFTGQLDAFQSGFVEFDIITVHVSEPSTLAYWLLPILGILLNPGYMRLNRSGAIEC